MFCFGSPSRQTRLKYYNDHHILIHAQTPCNASIYMPHISKHIVQEEADDVIDDPSSIFYDPKEKSGFVYTAIPSITNSYKFSLEQINSYPSCPDISDLNAAYIDNKHITKTLNHQIIKESPISSDYDDSLDRTRSLQNTPTLKNINNVFNDQCNVSSNKDSLEYDPMKMDNDYHAVLNIDGNFTPKIKSPIGLSEAEVKKLYDFSHEGSLVDDYADLQLYEDEILNTCKNTMKIKGYLSDAESTKTYQDSGIYDDDVFIDSPKPFPNDQNHQRLVFGTEEDQEEEEEGGGRYLERFSAFKTPMSSRNNSLESLLSLESPTEKTPPPQQVFKQIRRNENSGGDKPWKTNNKYSHIPAKVECHRRKSERSPSPGESLLKKSPSVPKPPMVFGKFNKSASNTKSNTSINSRVDSLSNLKHEPGGGEKKIFNEKLNFRDKAKPRTDTHGIEMYSHLPTEFQEIARRLARQDSQLKRQDSTRGRTLSRSRTSSRQSSLSPTRGRSRVRRSKKITPGNSISDIFAAVNSTKVVQDTPTMPQRPSLSRSSSCRSIPSTPHLSRQHPSTTLRQEHKSPSPGPSPNRRKEKESRGSTKKDRLSHSPITKASSPIGLQLKTSSADHPSPVSKLYQFTTQNDSFGSPQYSITPTFQQMAVR